MLTHERRRLINSLEGYVASFTRNNGPIEISARAAQDILYELKKRNPVRPYVHGHRFYCPSCHERLNEIPSVGIMIPSYCVYCGQSIAQILQEDETERKRTFGMTGWEYQNLAARTIGKNMGAEDQEMHALHGMVGEIGELHSIYQKIYQGHTDDAEHKQKEIGDLLWFVAEYCTANGWDLDDIMAMNIEKLRARYPDGFDSERSLHRKEGDI